MAQKVLKSSGKYYLNQDDSPTLIVTANKTIVDTDFGLNLHIGTDALVMTLPAITEAIYGRRIGFTNIGADGNNIITISPAAADGIHGTIILADSIVELSGTVNKDLINTKATATTGNTVWLEASSIGWLVMGSTGIWASE